MIEIFAIYAFVLVRDFNRKKIWNRGRLERGKTISLLPIAWENQPEGATGSETAESLQ
jgi:hypothetical protein